MTNASLFKEVTVRLQQSGQPLFLNFTGFEVLSNHSCKEAYAVELVMNHLQTIMLVDWKVKGTCIKAQQLEMLLGRISILSIPLCLFPYLIIIILLPLCMQSSQWIVLILPCKLGYAFLYTYIFLFYESKFADFSLLWMLICCLPTYASALTFNMRGNDLCTTQP